MFVPSFCFQQPSPQLAPTSKQVRQHRPAKPYGQPAHDQPKLERSKRIALVKKPKISLMGGPAARVRLADLVTKSKVSLPNGIKFASFWFQVFRSKFLRQDPGHLRLRAPPRPQLAPTSKQMSQPRLTHPPISPPMTSPSWSRADELLW